jgi:hypothetical protein
MSDLPPGNFAGPDDGALRAATLNHRVTPLQAPLRALRVMDVNVGAAADGGWVSRISRTLSRRHTSWSQACGASVAAR